MISWYGPARTRSAIRLRVTGAAVRLDGQDNLLLGTGATLLAQRAPVIYQHGATGEMPVAGRYRLLGQDTVGFTVAGYDHSRTLVIDPLVYSTYLGGSGADVGTAIAADADGNAYVTGSTTPRTSRSAPKPASADPVGRARLPSWPS